MSIALVIDEHDAPHKAAAAWARSIAQMAAKRAGLSVAQRKEVERVCAEEIEREIRKGLTTEAQRAQRRDQNKKRARRRGRGKKPSPCPLPEGEGLNLVGVAGGLPFEELIAENCAGLVKARAKRAALKYGVDFDDAVGHGFVALQRAIRAYDSRKSAGCKFTTYATTAIDREIVKHLVGDPGRKGTLVPEGVRTFRIGSMRRGEGDIGGIGNDGWTPEAEGSGACARERGETNEMLELLKKCAVRVAGPHMATLAIEAALYDRQGLSEYEIAERLGVGLPKAREAVTKGRKVVEQMGVLS